MTITIRRATPKDAAAHARILSDPGVQPGLLQMPYVDEAILFARLTEACAPGKTDLPLTAELDGDIVGSAGLHPVGPQVRRRHVVTFGISVLPSAQGRGVGTALMTAMCDYADRWVGARRIELTVYTDNEPAIRLYRRFGFAIEGTLRGYAMRDGRFVDAYAMARWIAAPERLDPPA